MNQPKPIIVKLDRQEFFVGAQVGIMRNISSIMRGGTDRHGMEEVRKWWDAVNGACGEIAFAKAHGFFWHASVDASQDDPRSDVLGYDVKTHEEFRWLLRIRPDEAKRPKWYAHVTGIAPTFHVFGCFWGPDVLAHPEWLKALDPSRPPAYLVPFEMLLPVSGPNPKPKMSAVGA